MFDAWKEERRKSSVRLAGWVVLPGVVPAAICGLARQNAGCRSPRAQCNPSLTMACPAEALGRGLPGAAAVRFKSAHRPPVRPPGPPHPTGVCVWRLQRAAGLARPGAALAAEGLRRRDAAPHLLAPRLLPLLRGGPQVGKNARAEGQRGGEWRAEGCGTVCV